MLFPNLISGFPPLRLLPALAASPASAETPSGETAAAPLLPWLRLSEQAGQSWLQSLDWWSAQRQSSRGVAEIAWQHAEKLGRTVRQQLAETENQVHGIALPVLTRSAQAARAAGAGAGTSPVAAWQALGDSAVNPWTLGQQWLAYWTDATQRSLLMLDTLRQRGNAFVEHEAAGMPPVLDFDYEVVVDGHTLARPVNYSLLRIVPPAGVQVDDSKRPFMIVDPRAGHGAGIGGFKPESQVGEAFEEGHPVYFVSFRPVPEPGQTLADVRDAEVGFVREVARRHPQAPKPAVIGNCQGGWATMLLAASAPDDVGPVVINGAPMSYWAGKVGSNPMRYLGGLAGGVLPALLLSDLGAGVFDGSSLVMNFENMNPANSLFKKYYNVYAHVDTEAERFLEFERWWGGFFLMNEEEIRWIVENLFVGNRLARGEARLGDQRIDLRCIQSPIIVFASHGDNITPPQQALNWIADCYRDADEIKARGQRIVYMVHDSIGHLGIFVSAKIAKHEHDAITDTIHAIEGLAPGLYEMKLDDAQDRTHIRFEPRQIDDILALDDGRDDEQLFASVARLSELGAELYDLSLRPWLRAAVTPDMAKTFRQAQPLRSRRVAYSDRNPLMPLIGELAQTVRAHRQPVAADNLFAAAERVGAQWLENQLNLYRDARDAGSELMFHAIYDAPAVKAIGQDLLRQAQLRRDQDVRALPAVRQALEAITTGGAVEGTVRMLLLMGKARGYLRRSRIERLQAYQNSAEFAGMDAAAWERVMYQQAIIVDFEPERALSTLPQLLDTEQERRDAMTAVRDIMGAMDTMHPAAQVLYRQFEQLLGCQPLAQPAPTGASATADTPAPRQPLRPVTAKPKAAA